jgi:Protein of unknown function (DUF3105)
MAPARVSRASRAGTDRGPSHGGGVNWRIVVIGGGALLALMVAVISLAVVMGSGANPNIGQIQPDGGRTHIADGAYGGPYSSVPATSGPHWNDPANWGIYTAAAPLAESQSIHNLEHGGIIVWYQPARLSPDEIAKLSAFVAAHFTTTRYKFILSPWSGKDFGHAIAVTAWRWLLYLDSPSTDAIAGFATAHYAKSPEPLGGPGPPGG